MRICVQKPIIEPMSVGGIRLKLGLTYSCFETPFCLRPTPMLPYRRKKPVRIVAADRYGQDIVGFVACGDVNPTFVLVVPLDREADPWAV